MEQEMEPKHTAGFMTIIPQSLKRENSLPEEKTLIPFQANLPSPLHWQLHLRLHGP